MKKIKKIPAKTTLALLIFSVLFIGQSICLLWLTKKPVIMNEPITEPEENTRQELLVANQYSGGVLMFQKTVTSDSPTGQLYTTEFIEFDPENYPTKSLGSMSGSSGDFKYSDQKIYFVSYGKHNGASYSYEGLFVYDIATKAIHMIPLLGVAKHSQDWGLNDYLVSDDIIIYSSGGCAERIDCDIRMYDMNSGVDSEIVSGLPSSPVSGYELREYNADTGHITLFNGGGDGPYGYGQFLIIDVQTGEISKREGISYNGNCSSESLGEYGCTTETLKDNEYYLANHERFLAEQRSCNKYDVVFNEKDLLLVYGGRVEYTFKDSGFIFCQSKAE